jgi:peptide/nickel transport system substrate-binding protein
LLYEAPADFDARFMPKPALMRWTQNDPTHYRFTLNGAHRFSNGQPVTASDVVATYRAILDPALASPHRASLANIVSMKIVDEATVDIELAHPDPLFPGVLVIGVLPATAAAQAASPQPAPGSGAFALREPPSAKRYAFTRRADGQAFDFLVVDSEITRAFKLVRGELDLVQGGFAPENAGWLGTQRELVVSQRAGSTLSYLGFNLAAGPTEDLRVRQALALGIDRAAIVRHVFHDQARLAEALLIPEHWAGAPDLLHRAHDPTRARALLAASGFTPAHPLSLSYKTSSDQLRLRIATILQAQLAEVGVVLNIQSYDWATFYADIKGGRFELYGLSWVGLQLPDIFRYAFHSASVPPAGANRGRYASAEVDRLIEAAEASLALNTRAARYRDIQTALARDLPVLPLWYEDFVIVRRARLLGYDTNASGDYDGLADVRLAETP